MSPDFDAKAHEVLRTVARHMRESSRENEPVAAIRAALEEMYRVGCADGADDLDDPDDHL